MIKGFSAIPPQWKPALWIGVPLYLLANLYLCTVGKQAWQVGMILQLNLCMVLLTLLIMWLTSPSLDPSPGAATSRLLLWLQATLLLAIVGLTSFASGPVWLWSALVAAVREFGDATVSAAWFGNGGNAVANPVQYFVIPLALLLLLRAKPSELGLGIGHKAVSSALVWLALPVIICVVILLTAQVTVSTLAMLVLANGFQNGFFEEFLFRGALQTRLVRLISVPWALLLQALLFGLWHLHANLQDSHGDVANAIAFCIADQAFSGVIFGILFQRTRNLLVPTIAHVTTNVVVQLLS